MEQINILHLKELAKDFGLSYIENKESLTIVGERQLLIFTKVYEQFLTKQEEKQCQLTEIY